MFGLVFLGSLKLLLKSFKIILGIISRVFFLESLVILFFNWKSQMASLLTGYCFCCCCWGCSRWSIIGIPGWQSYWRKQASCGLPVLLWRRGGWWLDRKLQLFYEFKVVLRSIALSRRFFLLPPIANKGGCVCVCVYLSGFRRMCFFSCFSFLKKFFSCWTVSLLFVFFFFFLFNSFFIFRKTRKLKVSGKIKCWKFSSSHRITKSNDKQTEQNS